MLKAIKYLNLNQSTMEPNIQPFLDQLHFKSIGELDSAKDLYDELNRICDTHDGIHYTFHSSNCPSDSSGILYRQCDILRIPPGVRVIPINGMEEKAINVTYVPLSHLMFTPIKLVFDDPTASVDAYILIPKNRKTFCMENEILYDNQVVFLNGTVRMIDSDVLDYIQRISKQNKPAPPVRISATIIAPHTGNVYRVTYDK